MPDITAYGACSSTFLPDVDAALLPGAFRMGIYGGSTEEADAGFTDERSPARHVREGIRAGYSPI
jgi:hypothetical protein